MAKPLIPVNAIYERALELLDAEGSEALTTRRLATDLKISTLTLYQQVGSREQLIRALVAQHFSQLRLDFREYEDWETTALQWCLGLHEALRAHPFLTELMTIDDRKPVMDYLAELTKATLREGIPRQLAPRVLACPGQFDDQSHSHGGSCFARAKAFPGHPG